MMRFEGVLGLLVVLCADYSSPGGIRSRVKCCDKHHIAFTQSFFCEISVQGVSVRLRTVRKLIALQILNGLSKAL